MQKFNINTLRLATSGAYLKIGLYHGYAPGSTSVIHDRIRRGNSFAAVAMDGFNLPSPSEGVVMCPNTRVTPGSP